MSYLDSVTGLRKFNTLILFNYIYFPVCFDVCKVVLVSQLALDKFWPVGMSVEV